MTSNFVPDGFIIDNGWCRPYPVYARIRPYSLMYYCEHCKLFVDGEPHARNISDLGPLCGRQGTEYYCKVCESELGFIGKRA